MVWSAAVLVTQGDASPAAAGVLRRLSAHLPTLPADRLTTEGLCAVFMALLAVRTTPLEPELAPAWAHLAGPAESAWCGGGGRGTSSTPA